jgi:hypothetical protein
VRNRARGVLGHVGVVVRAPFALRTWRKERRKERRKEGKKGEYSGKMEGCQGRNKERKEPGKEGTGEGRNKGREEGTQKERTECTPLWLEDDVRVAVFIAPHYHGVIRRAIGYVAIEGTCTEERKRRKEGRKTVQEGRKDSEGKEGRKTVKDRTGQGRTGR